MLLDNEEIKNCGPGTYMVLSSKKDLWYQVDLKKFSRGFPACTCDGVKFDKTLKCKHIDKVIAHLSIR